ncbi:hypothetical protein KMC53_gp49 [Klebsiella phage LASTA]|uniref:Uncharacterized protein n=2 Tax=Lastavirus lasta TaxID=2845090 RepID=A0A6H0X3F3_9CAUD|nr:hypothetical protein KMC53_gp49 [Klebsiella phage LASTA]QIW86676.1 hypothetical protein 24149LASTA_00049 [Klebsiella phage LASTA]QIW86752.1 hypothetical protein 24147SJM3_00049 [Klebsiella phage SJM3]
MSGDSIFALCMTVAAVFFFIGYFSGRSDERDAEIRRAIVKNCSRKG